jgi:hypothetical protein
MRRTGDRAALLALFLFLPWVAAAETDFHQEADRNEVGLEDSFQLTVVSENAPEGSEVQFPVSKDFEVLSRFQSSQHLFQFGGSRNGIRRVERYTLVMRPLKAGRFVIPPAKLRTPDGTLQTASVPITVKPGSLAGNAAPQARSARPDPLAGFGPLPGFDDDPLDDLFKLPEERIPRNNSDLFLKAYIDRDKVYVGEQVTYSLYIFSRVDLATVDSVVLPKMDGFWSEDVETPERLAGEPRTLDGVPYRAYLIKRRALFPSKAGMHEIPTASAQITTGFFFSGRRLLRESNRLQLEVKPPPPGAPAEFRPEQVGRWKLSVDAEPKDVELGQPFTVRVALEGNGNLKRQNLPALPAVSGLRVYDPTGSDNVTTRQGRVGGRRVQEYLVMPQRTGSFTLPPLRFAYLDPKEGRYHVSETSPMELTVKPGQKPAAGSQASGGNAPATSAKNVLTATGPKPLRAEAELSAPAVTTREQRAILYSLLGAPLGLYGVAFLVAGARRRAGRDDPKSRARGQARAARERLARARALTEGPAEAFYTELERAVLSSLELRVGAPVGGLARTELLEKLAASGYPEPLRARALGLLEACEAARYAPGMGAASRVQLVADASAVIAGGEA